MISRRAALVAALALALLAGPAAAVCSACCPSVDETSAVMAIPACCGNCAPSLESERDRIAATVKKTTNDTVVAVLVKPTTRFALDSSFPPIPQFASPPFLQTPSPPPPLRL